MMNVKVMVLVSVVVFFMATPMMAADTELCQKISAYQDDAAFFVAYSKKDGKPIAIIESIGCSVRETLEKGSSIPLDFIMTLKEKEVETIESSVLRVHGSPGCYIPKAGGGWKCICCP